MSTLVENSPSETTRVDFAPTRSSPQAPVSAPSRASVASRRPKRRLPWNRILLGAAIVTVTAGGVGLYFHRAAGFETTDDAYLDGHIHPVSPRINGTVVRVLVDDNAHVQAGQPLVEIDSADLKLAVEGAAADLGQARANAQQVEAQLARAQADVVMATARIAQNAAELTRAQLDYQRAEKLAAGESAAISQQQLDTARAAFESTQAAQQSLVAQRSSAEAALSAVQAQQSVAGAQVQKAVAALDAARLQLDYTVIRAPVAGRVGRKNVEAGQRLQPGQPVMALVGDDVWVVANFKESQLAHLHAGQPVMLKIDAIEGREFIGTVQSFSPGTGAKFSLLPPDNSTGNFTKVVQRVPVKILLSADSVGADAERLFPGLSAVVAVSIRR